MRFFQKTLLTFVLLVPVLAISAIEAYEFENAQMEADYNKLVNELRCLVCQNQNLAGSNSELAQDLRRQTYEMLVRGESPEQVSQYMVDRYGDFVLYRPPFKASTLLLWGGPFLLMIVVLWIVLRNLHNKQELVPPDDNSIRQAKDLLSEKPPADTRENS